MVRLNIGAGKRNPQPGYLALDSNLAMRPDIVARVPPIPVADGSCETIYCSHLIEHLTNEDASALIAEMWRVLAMGGATQIIAPNALTQAAYQDPTHRSYWVPERFRYYTPVYRYLGYDLETRFELVRPWTHGTDVAATPRKVAA